MRKTLVWVPGLALVSVLPWTTPTADTMIGVSVPSKVALVAPEQAGKIVAIPVSDGDRVAAHDVLFELSSRLEQLEVDRLRALAESDLIRLRATIGLRHAEQQESRVRHLREQDIYSDRDLQDQVHAVELERLRLQQAEVEQAQLANELAQATERLAQRTVRSPFDGVVTQRFKGEGEAVEKFVPVLEVMSLDPLWVEFDCPVANEQAIRVGHEVVVAPAVRPEETRPAKILMVSMKATASSHTFMVRAAVDNHDRRWKAGLKMVIQAPRGEANPTEPIK